MPTKPTVMQWTKRLLAKIAEQEAYAAPYERRYANEHILPFLAKEYAEVYPGLVVASADGRIVDSVVTGSMHSMLDVPKSGTAGIVVDALTERLTLGGLTAPDDKDAGKKLEAAWEDNDLDVMHHEGHREALIGSRAFASAAREVRGNRAVVGIESMTQAAVSRSQSAPYNVEAYLKVWKDEWTGENVGLLRLPGLDYDLFESDAEVSDPEGSGEASRWQVKGDPRPTRLAGVPVVELAPRSRLLKDPVSEIAPIASLVDIVDLVEGLLVFAGHFGAVPIRYATGLDIPRDPNDPSKPLLGPDGKPMIGFKPRADHFWVNSNKDAKFGQLEPAGLASFVTWAEHASAKVRAKTALASTYFSLDLKSHMSAELLKTDEAPMVRRVRRMGEYGSLNQAWRRLGQWILAIESPATRTRVRPRWEDPETRIEAQLVDQFTKLTASGLGVATCAREVLGWDPETITDAVAEYEATLERRRAAESDPIERLSRQFLGDPTLVG
ncbi:hypothetical protein [Pimelobacter simplex]|uniref:hypothetical protein n=1 Tax=Nocardioides simplex TaxID=2045 RepID=UPI00214FA471|nr:hypothetical protein [Pimelobacter simplex]UUW88391.1 hypothetical protein M0M43_21965 [Pimelobacter simplex]UUW97895.1 hypothetical protein M0M48_10610 [Pimelobacter simplex]